MIESLEARLNQGELTQSEIDNLQGGLTWWRAQGIFYYGSASNFVLASGILALAYAIIYSVLFTWRESMRAKQINAKRQETSQVKFEEKETDNFQYEKTRKTERTSFPIAGGLLTIIASWIVMVFSGILVFGGILTDSSQFSTQGVTYLADGAFGILVSAFALTGGIMILKRKNFAFAIIAMCFMVVKGATFIISTGGDFWGLFIGVYILALTMISLIFTSISYKEFS
ncbi:hypothetical protein JXA31_08430 [Candidatus Bathyarchaeota archaeon]|nr:hypothetical protein [Candidatus Bathyarchaeota archaeon]